MSFRFVFMKLRDREAEYFDLLVQYCQSTSPADKRACHEQIRLFRNMHLRNLGREHDEYFVNWYNVALRELLTIASKPTASRALSRMLIPSPRPNDIRKSLNLLQKLGLIKRKANGAWEPSEKFVSTPDEWTGTAIHTFQIAMAELGNSLLTVFPKCGQEKRIGNFGSSIYFNIWQIAMKPFLIIGMGNLLRSDDGAGIRAVNLLLDSGPLPHWVEAVDAGSYPLDLTATVAGRKWIVAIDAVEASAPPGSIFRFPASQMANTANSLFAVHEAGLHEALAAVRALGERPRVDIVGIVPADAKSMSAELTPAVKAALPEAVKVVRSLLHEYQKSRMTLPAGGDGARK
jgi:hydrogenase maturation protease